MSRRFIRVQVDRPRRWRSVLALALVALVATAFAAGRSSLTGPRIADASRLAGIAGAGVSGVQITNLSPTQAMLANADFYRQGGADVVKLQRPDIPPRTSANIYLPLEAVLTNGAYAAIVTTDQPSGTVTRTDWAASGGVILDDAAPAGTTVMAPLVVRGFGGQTSLVIIQNLDTANNAEVAVAVRGLGSADVLVNTTFMVTPGTSISLDLGRHPAFASLPPAFAGSLTATAPTPIAVQVITDVETSAQGVYDYSGAATGAASLFVPQFRAGHLSIAQGVGPSGIHDTWIAVGNLSAAAAQITVRYHGQGGACAGQTVIHGGGPIDLPAGASLIFSQGADGVDLPTGASGLAAGCTGAARIDATGAGGAAIAAAIVDLKRDTIDPARVLTAAAYNAFRADEAATHIEFPLFRREHTSMRLSSDITVMNPGSDTATARLIMADSSGSVTQGCGTACEAVLAPGASHTWHAEDTDFAPGRYGSAHIESDRPVVAIEADVSRARSMDTGIYRGLGEPAAPGTGPWASRLPLLLRAGGSIVSPTATPAGGERVTIFAIGLVDVFGGSDPSCPGCDGQFGPEDEAHAALNPLSPLTFVLTDDTGREVARAASESLASLQRARLDAPRLAAGRSYTLALLDNPSAYALCANETASRVLRDADFQLGSIRKDFHFNTRSCVPATPAPTPTVIAPLPAPRPKAAGVTGVQIANLSEVAESTLTLDAYAQTGGQPVPIARPNVAPMSYGSFYLPSESNLAAAAYAGIASGDAPIGTDSLTHWPDSGAVVIHDDAAAATDVVVPWVVKGVGGQNTIVAVQNYDTAGAVAVAITLSAEDGTEVASLTRSIGAGTSIMLDLGRDPAFASAPIGFMGTLRARAATRIAAAALIDYEHSRLGIAGFNGEPAVAASDTLLVPLARNRAPIDPGQPAAGWNQTRIAIANPGTADVQVISQLVGISGSCAGQNIDTAEPVSIAPDGVNLFEMESVHLPAGCGAAATFTATGGGMLGVAIDTIEAVAGSTIRTAAAYNALRPSDAGRKVPLPFVRRLHTPMKLSTDIAVMNPGSETATVTVDILSGRLNEPVRCGAPCTATIAPGATHLFITDVFTAWPMGNYGTGTVRSDRPVVVTVADISRALAQDTSMYRGASTDTVAGPGLRARPLPLLLNNAMARLPGGAIVPYRPAAVPPDPSPLALVPLIRVYLPFARNLQP